MSVGALQPGAAAVPMPTGGLGRPLLATGHGQRTEVGPAGNLVSVAPSPTATVIDPGDRVEISSSAARLSSIHRSGAPTDALVRAARSHLAGRQGSSGGFERASTFAQQVLDGRFPVSSMGGR